MDTCVNDRWTSGENTLEEIGSGDVENPKAQFLEVNDDHLIWKDVWQRSATSGKSSSEESEKGSFETPEARTPEVNHDHLI
jgi:hypothetical protein